MKRYAYYVDFGYGQSRVIPCEIERETDQFYYIAGTPDVYRRRLRKESFSVFGPDQKQQAFKWFLKTAGRKLAELRDEIKALEKAVVEVRSIAEDGR